MKTVIAAAGLVAAAQAFTAPVQPPTYGSLLTPDVNTPVTTGQDFTVTWTPKQPAAGVTVSLALCKGPSTNCVLQSAAVVEGIPAETGSYKWSVPCGLTPGVQNTDTGYGMLIIVDGTGEFQYSTQFSVLAGASCGGSSSSSSSVVISSSSSVSVSSSSAPVPPPSSSSSAASSSASDGWNSWSSASSTLLTSTVPLPSTSVVPTTPAAITTTTKAAETTTYAKPSTTAPAVSTSSTVSAPPKQFTGAAVAPVAFANAAGLVGAAALAMLAL